MKGHGYVDELSFTAGPDRGFTSIQYKTMLLRMSRSVNHVPHVDLRGARCPPVTYRARHERITLTLPGFWLGPSGVLLDLGGLCQPAVLLQPRTRRWWLHER